MTPKYQIYASLLAGTWMPWLEINRQQERFEYLLQPIECDDGKGCINFFRRITKQTGFLHSPAMQRFSREVNYLAEACNVAGDKGGTAFFGLSAATSSQQFYNHLIGYSFNGYHRWATELLADFHDTELSDWYRKRMARILLELIKFPVFWPYAKHYERVIACRALLAICILHHRLMFAGGNQQEISPLAYNLRDLFYANIKAFKLKASAGEEIIGLFDALTTDMKQCTPGPVISDPAGTLDPNASSARPADDPYVTSALKEMKTNLDVMKKAMNHLYNADQQSDKQPAADPNQLLDSATVSKMLSISSTSLQRYRDTGKLPFTKIGGKYCYLEKDILHFIEKGKNQKKHSVAKKNNRK